MIGFKSQKEIISGKYADAVRKAAVSGRPQDYQKDASSRKELKTTDHSIRWK